MGDKHQLAPEQNSQNVKAAGGTEMGTATQVCWLMPSHRLSRVLHLPLPPSGAQALLSAKVPSEKHLITYNAGDNPVSQYA